MVADDRVPLGTIAAQWSRIGVTGFGGPPAHIALFRKLCVDERSWLSAADFEDGIAATSLLPGPASTQLAIFCAWRLRGPIGALLGGFCFIVPGLVIILALSALFVEHNPPLWVVGAAAGAGAGVPAVALGAAVALVPASWKRARGVRARETRWILYLLAGAVSGAVVGEYLALVLALCGLVEVSVLGRPAPETGRPALGAFPILAVAPVLGGLAALAFVAFKVGALSYGGGFVIIPLMQHDAVNTYHWMTNSQFLNAVALGQVTPGPVVQTVAVVGYAARGLGGGLLASFVAFAPSFVFVLVGAPHFARLQQSARIQAFLTGAGACAIGAIAGVCIPLGLALAHLWQVAPALLAAGWLLALRKSVVIALIGCGAIGVVAVLAGAPA